MPEIGGVSVRQEIRSKRLLTRVDHFHASKIYFKIKDFVRFFRGVKQVED